MIRVNIKNLLMRTWMNRFVSLKICVVSSIFLVLSVLAVYANQEKDIGTPNKGTQKLSRGYLNINDLPETYLIPPPPALGTAGFALDDEINKKNLKLQGTPRFKLAAKDADLSFPNAADIFSCAVDAPITEKDTPRLYTLMRRMLIDAGNLSERAKRKYWRERPYLINKEPTCVPEYEKHMKNSSSYPSGHTIAGWAWALVLTEIVPDRADAILERGRAYGESRIVCNVHWYSDVIEGFLLGSALTAKLHALFEFRSDLDAARTEISNIKKKGVKPNKDCKKEFEIIRYTSN